MVPPTLPNGVSSTTPVEAHALTAQIQSALMTVTQKNTGRCFVYNTVALDSPQACPRRYICTQVNCEMLLLVAMSSVQHDCLQHVASLDCSMSSQGNGFSAAQFFILVVVRGVLIPCICFLFLFVLI